MELTEAVFGNSPHAHETLLAELRSQRRRLQQLIRLVDAEVRARNARSRHAARRCRSLRPSDEPSGIPADARYRA
jgi:septal ring factor EnvC (AmiA/AmiB activator)